MTRRVNVPALLSFAAALIFAVVTAVLLLEGYLLATGEAPITWYTECSAARYPLEMTFGACFVSAGLAALAAHLWWPGTRR